MKGCYGVFGGVFNRETLDASRNMLHARKPVNQGLTQRTRT